MTTTLWLRISSVVSLLFSAGHIMGGFKSWSPAGETPVLQAMRTVRFDAMGASRSYFDFYMGFGHTLSITLLLQTVLLWQLATLARTDARRVRPLILVFALATAAGGVVAWCLLIPPPAVFSVVLLATLLVAWAVAR